MTRLAGALVRGAGTVRWYVRAVVGEDAYERYVAHVAATRPGHPVPSEREFWRDKHAYQERHPDTRCC